MNSPLKASSHQARRLVSAFPGMLFLNIPGRAERVSGLGGKESILHADTLSSAWSLWMEGGRYTFAGFCPRGHFCTVLADSPHTHTHTHTHTLPQQTSESSFLSTGKTSPLRLWTSDCTPSWDHIVPSGMSPLVHSTKSTSGPGEHTPLPSIIRWEQCQPRQLPFGFS